MVTVSLNSLKTLWSGLGMGFQEGFWIDVEK